MFYKNGYPENYGCSFIVKLSGKKIIFFWENVCVFYKIYITCRRKKFICKKIVYWFFFTGKTLFKENEKNIYLIWEIFFLPENIYSFCKKRIFDHKKYVW